MFFVEDTNHADLDAAIDIYDMSAEEISSTLMANMPKSCSPTNAGDLANDLQLDSNFDLFAELNVNGKGNQFEALFYLDEVCIMLCWRWITM